MVRGCIPVIMMDGIKSEFEEELPLVDYSVRIPGEWKRPITLFTYNNCIDHSPGNFLYLVPRILKGLVETGRVAAMQVGLSCVPL